MGTALIRSLGGEPVQNCQVDFEVDQESIESFLEVAVEWANKEAGAYATFIHELNDEDAVSLAAQMASKNRLIWMKSNLDTTRFAQQRAFNATMRIETATMFAVDTEHV